MTEKTGGSDVGASSTMARQGADGHWRLTGEKWFCSAANAGAALTLARPDGAPPGTRGLAMFLVPEVTFAGAIAYPLYVKRWLRPPPAPAAALTARECEWLDAIVHWAPTPAEALAAVTGGPS
jgi:Acyl-CoA dehydrogenase, middle domain